MRRMPRRYGTGDGVLSRVGGQTGGRPGKGAAGFQNWHDAILDARTRGFAYRPGYPGPGGLLGIAQVMFMPAQVGIKFRDAEIA